MLAQELGQAGSAVLDLGLLKTSCGFPPQEDWERGAAAPSCALVFQYHRFFPAHCPVSTERFQATSGGGSEDEAAVLPARVCPGSGGERRPESRGGRAGARLSLLSDTLAVPRRSPASKPSQNCQPWLLANWAGLVCRQVWAPLSGGQTRD